MTQDRRFKKRVRARMAETGESYTTAYRNLRHHLTEETSMSQSLQTVTNHDFGYSLQIPESWRDVGPDLYNSPFEIARYLRNSPKIHDGIVNVFWDLGGESLRSLVERGNPDVFDLSVASLRDEGITDISVTDTWLGNLESIRLEYVYKLGDIDRWASRSYFAEVRGRFVCVNMGTSDLGSDADLYDAIALSFSAIENSVGIMLVRDDNTPGEFVAEVLEKTFNYQHRKAMQRSIQMNAQRESVVALVEADDAPAIVAAIAELSRERQYALTARVVGAAA